MQQNNLYLLIFLALALSLLAVAFSVYLFIRVRSLNKLRKTFFEGKAAKDLEDIISQVVENIKGMHDNQVNLESQLDELRKKAAFAIQRAGLVRFNPFSDGGGNFSFSLALLDETNSGFILTSMHGREQNRIYAKKVIKGKSEIQLTEEEQKALITANKGSP